MSINLDLQGQIGLIFDMKTCCAILVIKSNKFCLKLKIIFGIIKLNRKKIKSFSNLSRGVSLR